MAVNRSIQEILVSIRTAIFGKDVRESIAEGIEKCYDDAAGSNVVHKSELNNLKSELNIEDLQINHIHNGSCINANNEYAICTGNESNLTDFINVSPGDLIYIKVNKQLEAQGAYYVYGYETFTQISPYYSGKVYYDYNKNSILNNVFPIKIKDGENYLAITIAAYDSNGNRIQLRNDVYTINDISIFKVNGSYIDNITDINRLNDLNSIGMNLQQGYWGVANGLYTYSDNWCCTKGYIGDKTILITKNYAMYLLAYDKNDSYIGTWTGLSFEKTFYENKYQKIIDITKIHEQYPDYSFRIDFFNFDSEISTENILNDVDIYDKSTNVDFSYYPLSSKDVYEYGEVSIETNMYIKFPEGSSKYRARSKQDYIKEIPSGAEYVTVSIDSGAFSNGLYKIGWAQYTKDYIQIESTIRGWITDPTKFTQQIDTNAKYFMFYFASVSDNEIDLSNLHLEAFNVLFDNTSVDYGDQLSKLSMRSVYPQIQSIKDRQTLFDGDTIIYSVNHRGYSIEAPENTISAYILSKKKGFKYVECDVEFTSDNIPVLLHDWTINRTARNIDGTALSSTIYLHDITYEDSLDYDFGIWKGEKWSGTKMPTFEEFIIACKNLSLHPFVELKDIVDGEYWTDNKIKIVADIIKNAGMEHNVSFISFSLQALQKISEHFPKARLGLGFEGTYSEENFADYIDDASALVDGNREVVATVDYSSMTSTLYSMLIDAGINPLVWTVNTPETVINLNKSVVGVLSDNINAGKVIMENMFASLP